ncbi:MAG: hypothetical protein KAT79_03685 [candidate division Zixibacteria bacterium]|nr:hypothetical protein [candidate division Zixibacteria bacterium]
MKKRINLRNFAGTNRLSDGGERSHSVTAAVDPDDFKTNLFELMALLYRKRFSIGLITIAAMTITAAVMLLTSNQYTSTCSILPSGQIDQMAQLKSLAGLSGRGASDENSSMLYPQVLGSRHLYDAVLSSEFTYEENGRSVTTDLSEYFGSTNPDELRSQLADIMSVNVDQMTGMIRVSAETTQPALSQAILECTLTELENYNLYKRQSQGRESVQYLERELSRTGEELAVAEAALEDYRMANRDWDRTTDPIILTQHSRAQREVDAKAATNLYLERQLEVARLNAQKDTPIVRILDSPNLPTIKSSPRRALSVLLMGMVTLLLTSLLMILRDAFARWSGRSIGEIVRDRHDVSSEPVSAERVSPVLSQKDDVLV